MLSERELFVLRHLTHTNAQIAQMLGVSADRIKKELTGIYAKMGLSKHIPHSCKRVVAVMDALEQGVIQLDEISEGDRPLCVENQ